MQETVNFEAITNQMPDMVAAGDQIIAEQGQADVVMPFGTELFRDFDATNTEIGGLACALALSSKVDDSGTFQHQTQ